MKYAAINNSTQKFNFGRSFTDSKKLKALHLAFKHTGYAKLAGLFDDVTFSQIRKELKRLAIFAIARHFTMGGFETPRYMTTLGGQEIKKHSTLLSALYSDVYLRRILSRIVGHTLFDNLDKNEWTVGTYLKGDGQTHGFHIDDPPVALIIIVEAPPQEFGGVLEMVPEWPKISEIYNRSPEFEVGPVVEELRDLGLVQTKTHATSDAYLLRADRCLHAVAPLNGANTRRTIVNMAFELAPNVIRRSSTAAALFEVN